MTIVCSRAAKAYFDRCFVNLRYSLQGHMWGLGFVSIAATGTLSCRDHSCVYTCLLVFMIQTASGCDQLAPNHSQCHIVICKAHWVTGEGLVSLSRQSWHCKLWKQIRPAPWSIRQSYHSQSQSLHTTCESIFMFGDGVVTLIQFTIYITSYSVNHLADLILGFCSWSTDNQITALQMYKDTWFDWRDLL